MPDQVDWRALEREASPGRAVGRLLRDQREARGLDLATVEKSLKIRRANLEAIEEGRFDKLPGAAYIPAFLRAYAAHVGLDPEKVMTAYHLSGPVPIKRPVALPADFPIVEKRAPIGLAVLTVLLVVGVGYAAWHYLPREQSVVAEKVPPVPDRLLASNPNPAPSTEAHPPAAATHAPAQVGSGHVTPSAPPAQEARPASGNLPAEVWPARREAAAPLPPQPPQGTPLAPPVVAAVPPPPPPPVTINLPGPGQAQAAQPPAAAEQPRVATQQPQPPQQAAAPAVEEAARPAASPPAVEQPASVPVRADTTVRVRGNSWIELRAPNGDVLAQTYVRAGESYVVPAGIAYRIVDAR